MYYISSVSQQAEQFLKDFKEEWIYYFNEKEWIEIKKKKGKATETFLENTLRNTVVTLPYEIQELYDYYRLVRNYMSHNDRDIDAIYSSHKKIMKKNGLALSGLHIANSPPNTIENINFEDFLILTNIVKHIAYLICIKSKPSNKRIAEILFEIPKENKTKYCNGLKKLRNNDERYERALQSFAFTSFGRFSTVDIKEVTIHLKSLLA